MQAELRALASLFAVLGLSAAQDPAPPPGRMIDIGGWRLHLNCTGAAKPGRPIVILESGLGDFSVEWSLVQPKLSASGRVCSYDRAGTGWSELGPHPRTMAQIAYELHALLEKAGERPPFLLVGHSLGGWLVRIYNMKYPREVAGIVLLEGGFDDPWRIINGKLVRASELVKGDPIPPVQTFGPLKESDIPPAAMKQMKAGAASLVPSANAFPRSLLPEDAQRMRSWVLARWQHLASYVNPVEMEEMAALRAERANGQVPLGDRPLVVVTRGRADENGPGGQEAELARRTKEHADLAKSLSRNSRQVIAERSGHHVQLEQPDLVIQVINQAAP